MKMKMKIKNLDWYIRTRDDDTKTVSGTYAVMGGDKQVATQDFNDTYGSCDIAIPDNLISRLETIGEEVEKIIEENFNV